MRLWKKIFIGPKMANQLWYYVPGNVEYVAAITVLSTAL